MAAVQLVASGGMTPVDPQLAGYVRSGAEELVYADSFRKLGYLTVWAANYLLTGHHFRFSAYQVGGPIGQVWHYPKHRELRLDQPLVITKKNVDKRVLKPRRGRSLLPAASLSRRDSVNTGLYSIVGSSGVGSPGFRRWL